MAGGHLGVFVFGSIEQMYSGIETNVSASARAKGSAEWWSPGQGPRYQQKPTRCSASFGGGANFVPIQSIGGKHFVIA